MDPSDPAICHPVLNLLFLGKLIEKEVAKQLQVFLDNTLVLIPFQSGLHPCDGKGMALVALTDDLFKQLDLGGLVLLFLSYLTVVFNTVDYDLFAHYFAKVGMPGVTSK